MDFRQLAHAVDHFGSDIPKALMDGQAFAHLRSASEDLPKPSGEIVFELRLEKDDPRADLTLVYHRGDLEKDHHVTPLSTALDDFATDWLNPTSGLADIASVAYECDFVGDRSSGFVYPNVQPLHHQGFYAVARERHAEKIAGTLPRSLALASAFVNRYAPDTWRRPFDQGLQQCFAQLPDAGLLFYIATLHTRVADARPALRLLLSLPLAELLPFLRQMKWRGDDAWLVHTLPLFCPGQGRINFDLDFCADGLSDRIGLFCDFPNPRLGDARHDKVRHFLCQQRLACSDKVQAIDAWIARLPTRPPGTSPSCGLGYKLVCENGQAQAKIYFSCETSTTP